VHPVFYGLVLHSIMAVSEIERRLWLLFDEALRLLAGAPFAMVVPPSANMSAPVMKLASSEATNAKTLAISSGVPRRPSTVPAKVCFSILAFIGPVSLCVQAVSTGPGQGVILTFCDFGKHVVDQDIELTESFDSHHHALLRMKFFGKIAAIRFGKPAPPPNRAGNIVHRVTWKTGEQYAGTFECKLVSDQCPFRHQLQLRLFHRADLPLTVSIY
jgi:hypothetical protein